MKVMETADKKGIHSIASTHREAQSHKRIKAREDINNLDFVHNQKCKCYLSLLKSQSLRKIRSNVLR